MQSDHPSLSDKENSIKISEIDLDQDSLSQASNSISSYDIDGQHATENSSNDGISFQTKICSMCYLGETSCLGQGRLLRYDPSDGYNVFAIEFPQTLQLPNIISTNSLLIPEKNLLSELGDHNIILKPILSVRRSRGSKNTLKNNKKKNAHFSQDTPGLDELKATGFPPFTEVNAFFEKSGHTWVHEYCAFMSEGVINNINFFGNEKWSLLNVDKSVAKGITQQCQVCKNFGATLVCCIAECGNKYHLPCATCSGSILDIPKKAIVCPSHINLAITNITNLNCKVCMNTGDLSLMLSCITCGTHSHTYCLESQGLPYSHPTIHLKAGWQCNDCKMCQICKTRGDYTKFAMCDSCDKAFHIFCLRPSLVTVPKNGWKCKNCRMCIDCGSRTPGSGPSSRWHLSYTICDSCYQQRNKGLCCPICNRAYRQNFANKDKMSQCRACHRYIHIECDPSAPGIESYRCSICIQHNLPIRPFPTSSHQYLPITNDFDNGRRDVSKSSIVDNIFEIGRQIPFQPTTTLDTNYPAKKFASRFPAPPPPPPPPRTTNFITPSSTVGSIVGSPTPSVKLTLKHVDNKYMVVIHNTDSPGGSSTQDQPSPTKSSSPQSKSLPIPRHVPAPSTSGILVSDGDNNGGNDKRSDLEIIVGGEIGISIYEEGKSNESSPSTQVAQNGTSSRTLERQVERARPVEIVVDNLGGDILDADLRGIKDDREGVVGVAPDAPDYPEIPRDQVNDINCFEELKGSPGDDGDEYTDNNSATIDPPSVDDDEDDPSNVPVLFSISDKYTYYKDICVSCGSFGIDKEAILIFCYQCGQSYHPFCVSIKLTKTIALNGWRCYKCIICEGCGKADDESRLILCDDCDISYHIYCLNPPLTKIPEGTWKCGRCAMCHSCSSRDPGKNCEWLKNFTQCGPCGSRENCPLCRKRYQDTDLIMECSSCLRWVHGHCENIKDDWEAGHAIEKGFYCRLCSVITTASSITTIKPNDSLVVSQLANVCSLKRTIQNKRNFLKKHPTSHLGILVNNTFFKESLPSQRSLDLVSGDRDLNPTEEVYDFDAYMSFAKTREGGRETDDTSQQYPTTSDPQVLPLPPSSREMDTSSSADTVPPSHLPDTSASAIATTSSSSMNSYIADIVRSVIGCAHHGNSPMHSPRGMYGTGAGPPSNSPLAPFGAGTGPGPNSLLLLYSSRKNSVDGVTLTDKGLKFIEGGSGKKGGSSNYCDSRSPAHKVAPWSLVPTSLRNTSVLLGHTNLRGGSVADRRVSRPKGDSTTIHTATPDKKVVSPNYKGATVQRYQSFGSNVPSCLLDNGSGNGNNSTIHNTALKQLSTFVGDDPNNVGLSVALKEAMPQFDIEKRSIMELDDMGNIDSLLIDSKAPPPATFQRRSSNKIGSGIGGFFVKPRKPLSQGTSSTISGSSADVASAVGDSISICSDHLETNNIARIEDTLNFTLNSGQISPHSYIEGVGDGETINNSFNATSTGNGVVSKRKRIPKKRGYVAETYPYYLQDLFFGEIALKRIVPKANNSTSSNPYPGSTKGITFDDDVASYLDRPPREEGSVGDPFGTCQTDPSVDATQMASVIRRFLEPPVAFTLVPLKKKVITSPTNGPRGLPAPPARSLAKGPCDVSTLRQPHFLTTTNILSGSLAQTAAPRSRCFATTVGAGTSSRSGPRPLGPNNGASVIYPFEGLVSGGSTKWPSQMDHPTLTIVTTTTTDAVRTPNLTNPYQTAFSSNSDSDYLTFVTQKDGTILFSTTVSSGINPVSQVTTTFVLTSFPENGRAILMRDDVVSLHVTTEGPFNGNGPHRLLRQDPQLIYKGLISFGDSAIIATSSRSSNNYYKMLQRDPHTMAPRNAFVGSSSSLTQQQGLSVLTNSASESSYPTKSLSRNEQLIMCDGNRPILETYLPIVTTLPQMNSNDIEALLGTDLEFSEMTPDILWKDSSSPLHFNYASMSQDSLDNGRHLLLQHMTQSQLISTGALSSFLNGHPYQNSQMIASMGNAAYDGNDGTHLQQLPMLSGLINASKGSGAPFSMPYPHLPSITDERSGIMSHSPLGGDQMNSTASSTQRNLYRWQKDEALGALATISPVLYANIMYPMLKEEYPDMLERSKQIAKIWRNIAPEQRIPYLQKARENRAIIRVQKSQIKSLEQQILPSNPSVSSTHIPDESIDKTPTLSISETSNIQQAQSSSQQSYIKTDAITVNSGILKHSLICDEANLTQGVVIKTEPTYELTDVVYVNPVSSQITISCEPVKRSTPDVSLSRAEGDHDMDTRVHSPKTCDDPHTLADDRSITNIPDTIATPSDSVLDKKFHPLLTNSERITVSIKGIKMEPLDDSYVRPPSPTSNNNDPDIKNTLIALGTSDLVVTGIEPDKILDLPVVGQPSCIDTEVDFVIKTSSPSLTTMEDLVNTSPDLVGVALIEPRSLITELPPALVYDQSNMEDDTVHHGNTLHSSFPSSEIATKNQPTTMSHTIASTSCIVRAEILPECIGRGTEENILTDPHVIVSLSADPMTSSIVSFASDNVCTTQPLINNVSNEDYHTVGDTKNIHLQVESDPVCSLEDNKLHLITDKFQGSSTTGSLNRVKDNMPTDSSSHTSSLVQENDPRSAMFPVSYNNYSDVTASTLDMDYPPNISIVKVEEVRITTCQLPTQLVLTCAGTSTNTNITNGDYGSVVGIKGDGSVGLIEGINQNISGQPMVRSDTLSHYPQISKTSPIIQYPIEVIVEDSESSCQSALPIFTSMTTGHISTTILPTCSVSSPKSVGMTFLNSGQSNQVQPVAQQNDPFLSPSIVPCMDNSVTNLVPPHHCPPVSALHTYSTLHQQVVEGQMFKTEYHPAMQTTICSMSFINSSVLSIDPLTMSPSKQFVPEYANVSARDLPHQKLSRKSSQLLDDILSDLSSIEETKSIFKDMSQDILMDRAVAVNHSPPYYATLPKQLLSSALGKSDMTPTALLTNSFRSVSNADIPFTSSYYNSNHYYPKSSPYIYRASSSSNTPPYNIAVSGYKMPAMAHQYTQHQQSYSHLAGSNSAHHYQGSSKNKRELKRDHQRMWGTESGNMGDDYPSAKKFANLEEENIMSQIDFDKLNEVFGSGDPTPRFKYLGAGSSDYYHQSSNTALVSYKSHMVSTPQSGYKNVAPAYNLVGHGSGVPSYLPYKSPYGPSAMISLHAQQHPSVTMVTMSSKNQHQPYLRHHYNNNAYQDTNLHHQNSMGSNLPRHQISPNYPGHRMGYPPNEPSLTHSHQPPILNANYLLDNSFQMDRQGMAGAYGDHPSVRGPNNTLYMATGLPANNYEGSGGDITPGRYGGVGGQAIPNNTLKLPLKIEPGPFSPFATPSHHQGPLGNGGYYGTYGEVLNQGPANNTGLVSTNSAMICNNNKNLVHMAATNNPSNMYMMAPDEDVLFAKPSILKAPIQTIQIATGVGHFDPNLSEIQTDDPSVYQSWLLRRDALIQENLTNLSADIAKLRKRKKSLASKQRQLRKTGDGTGTLPDHESRELTQLNVNIAAMQKHIEALRKELKQHKSLISDFQMKEDGKEKSSLLSVLPNTSRPPLDTSQLGMLTHLPPSVAEPSPQRPPDEGLKVPRYPIPPPTVISSSFVAPNPLLSPNLHQYSPRHVHPLTSPSSVKHSPCYSPTLSTGQMHKQQSAIYGGELALNPLYKSYPAYRPPPVQNSYSDSYNQRNLVSKDQPAPVRYQQDANGRFGYMPNYQKSNNILFSPKPVQPYESIQPSYDPQPRFPLHHRMAGPSTISNEPLTFNETYNPYNYNISNNMPYRMSPQEVGALHRPRTPNLNLSMGYGHNNFPQHGSNHVSPQQNRLPNSNTQFSADTSSRSPHVQAIYENQYLNNINSLNNITSPIAQPLVCKAAMHSPGGHHFTPPPYYPTIAAQNQNVPGTNLNNNHTHNMNRPSVGLRHQQQMYQEYGTPAYSVYESEDKKGLDMLGNKMLAVRSQHPGHYDRVIVSVVNTDFQTNTDPRHIQYVKNVCDKPLYPPRYPAMVPSSSFNEFNIGCGSNSHYNVCRAATQVMVTFSPSLPRSHNAHAPPRYDRGQQPQHFQGHAPTPYQPTNQQPTTHQQQLIHRPMHAQHRFMNTPSSSSSYQAAPTVMTHAPRHMISGVGNGSGVALAPLPPSPVYRSASPTAPAPVLAGGPGSAPRHLLMEARTSLVASDTAVGGTEVLPCSSYSIYGMGNVDKSLALLDNKFGSLQLAIFPNYYSEFPFGRYTLPASLLASAQGLNNSALKQNIMETLPKVDRLLPFAADCLHSYRSVSTDKVKAKKGKGATGEEDLDSEIAAITQEKEFLKNFDLSPQNSNLSKTPCLSADDLSPLTTDRPHIDDDDVIEPSVLTLNSGSADEIVTSDTMFPSLDTFISVEKDSEDPKMEQHSSPPISPDYRPISSLDSPEIPILASLSHKDSCTPSPEQIVIDEEPFNDIIKEEFSNTAPSVDTYQSGVVLHDICSSTTTKPCASNLPSNVASDEDTLVTLVVDKTQTDALESIMKRLGHLLGIQTPLHFTVEKGADEETGRDSGYPSQIVKGLLDARSAKLEAFDIDSSSGTSKFAPPNLVKGSDNKLALLGSTNNSTIQVYHAQTTPQLNLHPLIQRPLKSANYCYTCHRAILVPLSPSLIKRSGLDVILNSVNGLFGTLSLYDFCTNDCIIQHVLRRKKQQLYWNLEEFDYGSYDTLDVAYSVCNQGDKAWPLSYYDDDGRAIQSEQPTVDTQLIERSAVIPENFESVGDKILSKDVSNPSKSLHQSHEAPQGSSCTSRSISKQVLFCNSRWWKGKKYRVWSHNSTPKMEGGSSEDGSSQLTAPEETLDLTKLWTERVYRYFVCMSLWGIEPTDNRTCLLCNGIGDGHPEKTSRLLNLDIDKWVHLNCALWSSEVYETVSGALMHVETALKRGNGCFCNYCTQPGATCDCNSDLCTNCYHFPCALAIECTFYDDKTLLCPLHNSDHEIADNEKILSSLAVHRRVYVDRNFAQQIANVMQRLETHTFRIGALVFNELGQLLPEQLENFHNLNFIYPIGYRTTRFYWDYRNLNARAPYSCVIKDVNDKPRFFVQVLDPCAKTVPSTDHSYDLFGGEIFEGSTPKEAWNSILSGIAKLRKSTLQTALSVSMPPTKLFPRIISGEELFGLSEGPIIRALESLPGVEQLMDYRFKYGRTQTIELPLTINPSGCARTEPKLRTHFRKPIILSSAPCNQKALPSSFDSFNFESGLFYEPSYGKQYGLSKEAQYRKMKSEWKQNIYLGKSRIQGLGLFASRAFGKDVMIIEYIGEMIRCELAEVRERAYHAQNKSTTYLFRLDDDTVLDATICGGPARYINHSCDPNCRAEVIALPSADNANLPNNNYNNPTPTGQEMANQLSIVEELGIEGASPSSGLANQIKSAGKINKIVIISNRKIQRGEELCYDYKFEYEGESNKISCLCGAHNCKKWMN